MAGIDPLRLLGAFEIPTAMGTDEAIAIEDGRRLWLRRLRAVAVYVLLPIAVLMNGCSILIDEQRNSARSGWLMAKVIRSNPGAFSDYFGVVRVQPRYFPNVWPFDLVVSCRALSFKSDPNVRVKWEGEALVIEHDAFPYPLIARKDRCYGRPIVLRQRSV